MNSSGCERRMDVGAVGFLGGISRQRSEEASSTAPTFSTKIASTQFKQHHNPTAVSGSPCGWGKRGKSGCLLKQEIRIKILHICQNVISELHIPSVSTHGERVDVGNTCNNHTGERWDQITNGNGWE